MIKAITFDLWDTVFIDESDEPKRKAAGRVSKKDERRFLVLDYAQKHKDVSKELVDSIYNTADAAFSKVWHDQFVTWEVIDRMDIIFKGLGINLPVNEMGEIVKLHEEMELEFRPDFIEGAGEAIEELSKSFKLGVISDAILMAMTICLSTLISSKRSTTILPAKTCDGNWLSMMTFFQTI